MNKQNESYQAGETVYHKTFGAGIVEEYIYPEGQKAQHNQVRVNFEVSGHKWLIAAPGYLLRKPAHLALVGLTDLTADNVASPAAEITSKQPPEEPKGQSRRTILKLFAGAFTSTPLMANAFNRGSITHKSLPILEARIAGFNYYQGSKHLHFIKIGDPLCLRRENTNQHDSNAIEVFWSRQKIGYVPRSHNAALSKLMDSGEKINAHVRSVKTDQSWEPLEFDVEVWVWEYLVSIVIQWVLLIV